MGFGDFWLQSNNGDKVDLNFRGKLRRADFEKDPKLLKIFDFFDEDGNGVIEENSIFAGNELSKMFSYFKQTAQLRQGGDDKVIDNDEAYSFTQYVEEFKNLNIKDVFNFLNKLNETKNKVTETKEHNYPDGSATLINFYEDGLKETVIYYPDGRVKFKILEKTENDTAVTGIKTSQKKIGEKEITEIENIEAPAEFKRTVVEFAPEAQAELREFLGTFLKDNANYALHLVDDAGWLSKAGIRAVHAWEDMKNSPLKSIVFPQIVFAEGFVNGLDDLNKYMEDAQKSFELGEKLSNGVKQPGSFNAIYERETGAESLDFLKVEEFRQTQLKYTEVKALQNKINMLEQGIKEANKRYQNAQAVKRGVPNAEKTNTDYRTQIVEVLTQFFGGNQKVATAFIASISEGIDSAEELDEKYFEIIEKIKQSAETQMIQLLDGETLENIEERYQKEHKELFGKEDVTPKIEELVMTGKEVGGMIQIGAMTAATIILGALTGGSGSVALDALIGYLETIDVDFALSLSEALTSKRGYTDEARAEILERTKGTACFMGFGMVIANPLAKVAGNAIAKWVGADTAKLAEGAFAQGAVESAVKTTTNGITKTTLSGGDLMRWVAVKGGEFGTEVLAFSGYELLTQDEDFLSVLGGQSSMLTKIKVMNSALNVMLGSFVKNRAVARYNKQAVNDFNKMLKESGLEDAKITEYKSPSSSIYTLEYNGKTLTFKSIEEMSAKVTTICAINYAMTREVSEEIKTAETPELLREYKELIEKEKPTQEEHDRIMYLFKELTVRGVLEDGAEVTNIESKNETQAKIGTEDLSVRSTKPSAEISDGAAKSNQSSVLKDIEKYIEGYKQYGEDYIPEGLSENSVFMEFFRAQQKKCQDNPALYKYKLINPKTADNPKVSFGLMQELQKFILEESQYATREDYEAVVEANAKTIAEQNKKSKSVRPEFNEAAAQIYKWKAYTAGQIAGERLPDGSYSLEKSRIFDQEKNDQAAKEFVEFLEKVTGKKVLYDNTARFDELIQCAIRDLNSPEAYADVDYILITHGTGNSRITETGNPDGWMFKHSGKSVYEFIEENVPEGKKVLVDVCEHDGSDIETRKTDESMYDKNGTYMSAIGEPVNGDAQKPIKICTSGIRHITGAVKGKQTFTSAEVNGVGGIVVTSVKTEMYDFDYEKYRAPKKSDSKTEKSSDVAQKGSNQTPAAGSKSKSGSSIIGGLLGKIIPGANLSKEQRNVIKYIKKQVKSGKIDKKYLEAVEARLDSSIHQDIFKYLDKPEELEKFIQEHTVEEPVYKQVYNEETKKYDLVQDGTELYFKYESHYTTLDSFRKMVQNAIDLKEFLETQSIPEAIEVHRHDSFSILKSIKIGDKTMAELMEEASVSGDYSKLVALLNQGGADVEFDNFVGTSMVNNEPVHSEEPYVQWKINVPKGSKGAFLESMVKDNLADEMEFLLQAGTKLKIKHAEYKDGKWYIEADVEQTENLQPKDYEYKTVTKDIDISNNKQILEKLNTKTEPEYDRDPFPIPPKKTKKVEDITSPVDPKVSDTVDLVISELDFIEENHFDWVEMEENGYTNVGQGFDGSWYYHFDKNGYYVNIRMDKNNKKAVVAEIGVSEDESVYYKFDDKLQKTRITEKEYDDISSKTAGKSTETDVAAFLSSIDKKCSTSELLKKLKENNILFEIQEDGTILYEASMMRYTINLNPDGSVFGYQKYKIDEENIMNKAYYMYDKDGNSVEVEGYVYGEKKTEAHSADSKGLWAGEKGRNNLKLYKHAFESDADYRMIDIIDNNNEGEIPRFNNASFDITKDLLKTDDDFKIFEYLMKQKFSDDKYVYNSTDIMNIMKNADVKQFVLDQINSGKTVKRHEINAKTGTKVIQDAYTTTMHQQRMIPEKIEDITIAGDINEEFKNNPSFRAKIPEGEVANINGKMYCNDGEKLVELDMTKEMFEKLFPPSERFRIRQRTLGDCYNVTAMSGLLDTPKGRAYMYSMFHQEGKDVVVKFPEVDFGLRFDKCKPNDLAIFSLTKKEGKRALGLGSDHVKACLGITLLEEAYAVRQYYEYDDNFKANEKVVNKIFFMNEKMQSSLGSGGHSYDAIEDYVGRDNRDVLHLSTRDCQECIDLIAENINNPNLIITFDTESKFKGNSEYNLYNNHAYRIASFDKETGMVGIVNPWNCNLITNIPIYELFNYVSGVALITIK